MVGTVGVSGHSSSSESSETNNTTGSGDISIAVSFSPCCSSMASAPVSARARKDKSQEMESYIHRVITSSNFIDLQSLGIDPGLVVYPGEEDDNKKKKSSTTTTTSASNNQQNKKGPVRARMTGDQARRDLPLPVLQPAALVTSSSLACTPTPFVITLHPSE